MSVYCVWLPFHHQPLQPHEKIITSFLPQFSHWCLEWTSFFSFFLISLSLRQRGHKEEAMNMCHYCRLKEPKQKKNKKNPPPSTIWFLLFRRRTGFSFSHALVPLGPTALKWSNSVRICWKNTLRRVAQGNSRCLASRKWCGRSLTSFNPHFYNQDYRKIENVAFLRLVKEAKLLCTSRVQRVVCVLGPKVAVRCCNVTPQTNRSHAVVP